MELSDLIFQLGLFFNKYAYPTVFIGSFIETTPLGWMIPGGLILALGGFFVKTGEALSLPLLILWGSLGVWFSLIISYVLGLKTGNWLIEKLNQQKNAEFAKNLLKKHGGSVLTTSMMANLTRFWVAYAAGLEKFFLGKFIIYSLSASFSWTSLLVLTGYFIGYEGENLENISKTVGFLGWLLLFIALFFLFKSIKKEYLHFKKDLPHK